MPLLLFTAKTRASFRRSAGQAHALRARVSRVASHVCRSPLAAPPPRHRPQALLTLNESGLPFTIDEVSLTDKPAHFSALYARALGHDAASTGKVPILQDGAFILTESLAICEYVAAKAGGSLLAATPEERARAALFADLVAKIGPSCFALLRVPKGGAEAAAAAAALTEALAAVSGALALCGGPFLLGERLTVSDIALWPFLERLSVVHHFRDYAMPEEARLEPLRRWTEAMRARESVKKTENSAEFLIPHYSKYVA